MNANTSPSGNQLIDQCDRLLAEIEIANRIVTRGRQTLGTLRSKGTIGDEEFSVQLRMVLKKAMEVLFQLGKTSNPGDRHS
jgi:hypothetical protein